MNASRFVAHALALVCATALVSLPVSTARADARVAPASDAPPAYGAGRVVQRNGYPEYDVDGKPFFMFGAAFFYDRLPRDEWAQSLESLRGLGINTIDLYVPWNWHELADGDFDFDGRTNPRRDLRGLLQMIRGDRFHIIVRPGPVIRNEWRNGGYPQWLLERPEYGMPLRDVLEGRYPATATLQNAHGDDAAAQWMRNGTHMRYARRWLERAMHEFDPVADLVLAVALDDDQGAYIDNQTWPAPHLQAYLEALRATVTSVTGPNVPTFINTYQMKVPASSHVWTMGNWYQSDAYSIGEHDRSQLEFSTALLQTRPKQPLWTSEFQAGWLLQPNDVVPQPADPTNTTLALGTMLQQGVRGVVDFPAQDTLAPAGYEAPFSNASYAWDAALPFVDPTLAPFEPSRPPRWSTTERFAYQMAAFGPQLAATHVVFDASIAWLPSAYDPVGLTNADYAALADRTVEAQRACRDAGLTCRFVDLRFASDGDLARSKLLLLPRPHDGPLARRPFTPIVAGRLRALESRDVSVATLGDDPIRAATLQKLERESHRRPVLSGGSDATFAASDDDVDSGFLTVVNYRTNALRHGAIVVRTSPGHATRVPPFDVPARGLALLPLGSRLDRFTTVGFRPNDRLEWATCSVLLTSPARGMLVLSPYVGVPACAARLRIRGVERDYDVSTRSYTFLGRGVAAPTPARTMSPAELQGADAAFRNARRPGGPLDQRFARPSPATPQATDDARIPISRDTLFHASGFPIVPSDRASAAVVDVFRDGFPDVVLQNDRVRVIVSPNAGGRSFVFEDLARETSGFDSVGALRDDVAIQPPLSTSDRIAKYTHQFPAGFFNRPYAVKIVQSGARAVVTLTYAAPDAFPNGATFTRTLTLAPHSRDLIVDESAAFADGTMPDQHGVAITSLAVGDPRAPTTQHVLPEGTTFATPLGAERVGANSEGATAGLYDDVSHEAILVVSNGALRRTLEPAATPHTLVVTADVARSASTRTIFRYDFPPDLASARAELSTVATTLRRAAPVPAGARSREGDIALPRTSGGAGKWRNGLRDRLKSD